MFRTQHRNVFRSPHSPQAEQSEATSHSEVSQSKVIGSIVLLLRYICCCRRRSEQLQQPLVNAPIVHPVVEEGQPTHNTENPVDETKVKEQSTWQAKVAEQQMATAAQDVAGSSSDPRFVD